MPFRGWFTKATNKNQELGPAVPDIIVNNTPDWISKGADDQLKTAEEYKSLVLAYRNGAPIRLSDVADMVDGAENSKLGAWANRTPAIILNIQRQPGANVIDVVDRIKTLLPELQESLPQSLDVQVLTDRTTPILPAPRARGAAARRGMRRCATI